MEIKVRGLRKSFSRNGQDPLRVLDSIDFNVDEGQFVTLIGPSGCGKTTILKIIAGIEKADEGKIETLPSNPIDGFPIVWQEHRLYPWRTILENITFPLELRNLELSKIEEKAKDLLKLMDLSKFEDYYPWQVSLGMAQRVAIARALAIEPNCLLMDEPFASVDYQTKQVLFQQLRQLHKQYKLTILYVTHDLRDAIRFSDRIIILTSRPARVRDIMELTKVTMSDSDLEKLLWDMLLDEKEIDK